MDNEVIKRFREKFTVLRTGGGNPDNGGKSAWISWKENISINDIEDFLLQELTAQRKEIIDEIEKWADEKIELSHKNPIHLSDGVHATLINANDVYDLPLSDLKSYLAEARKLINNI